MAALGVPKERLLHTAESLYHDHVPAKRFGLATAWIYRRAAKGNFGATRAPEAPVKPDWQVTTLAELADLHRKETRG
jgi:2-haloacid dehalogenase